MDWEKAIAIGIEPAARPEAHARWAAVPESMDTGRKLKALEKAFGDHVYSTQKMALFENRDLELTSTPGETLDAFRRRCKEAADEKSKEAKEMETVKFTPKIEAAEQSTSKNREDRIAKLKADLQAKKDELTEKYRRIAEEATPIQVKPRKVDIRVTHFGLAWARSGVRRSGGDLAGAIEQAKPRTGWASRRRTRDLAFLGPRRNTAWPRACPPAGVSNAGRDTPVAGRSTPLETAL